MTVLPSPIPHPLDFCPWQLPGWVYETLDWVVGVEWPEGNEKAVWDLADQWYSVATTLAGPRADAITAAGEVRSGYGAVGAVAAAFDTAWKKVADGDEAPLPLLLAVSADLGRLVEECGCDIEGAKLEVWIELGILVVELLGMAVAVVLTAGAASPAAAAAITATRFVVQQIFKKLIAQLARKTLKKGMQEATERAAKQVPRDGLRGLGRNAVRGGLIEAAEEGGVNLAIQGYQNSTGRRDGLDLADLGTSAVGGFAGGAAAPLAGLGRHATGPGGRLAENFGREISGEVIAEQAASLATGGGFVSLEDAARAAASGATGSAVSQSDAALQARLDGRLNALAGTTLDPSPTPTAPTESRSAPPGPVTDSTAPIIPAQRTTSDSDGPDGGTSTPLPRASGPENSAGPAPVESRGTTSGSVESYVPTDRRPDAASRPVAADPVTATSQSASTLPTTSSPAATVTATPTLSTVIVDPVLAASPVTTAAPVDLAPTTTTGTTPSTASTAPSMPTTASPVVASAPAPSVAPGPVPTPATGPNPTMLSGPAPTLTTTPTTTGVPAPPVTPSTPAVSTNPTMTAGPTTTAPTTTLTTGTPSPSSPTQHGGTAGTTRTTPSRPDPSPLNDLSLLEVLAPNTSRSQANAEPAPAPAPGPGPRPPTNPAPRTPEWYEARWAADREALERRRYQGYFNSQRAWFEDRRREEEVIRLRALAEEHILKASEYADQAIRLRREGNRDLAKFWHEAAVNEERACHRHRDLAEKIRDGTVVPNVTVIETDAHFRRINDDVAELAVGGVETDNRSALTGDDSPPSSDQTRPYGERGGLRPPLALHQTDLERQMPRESDGSVTRTADPRQGRWFSLVNDGGPSADATRSINCLDCTLSLYETWLHGRPRVSAPRTFDGYLGGDVNRPINGETGGPGRVESVTGGVYQSVASTQGMTPAGARQQVMQGYADLHRQMLSGGHGSFAFLVNTWEGGGAHAWVALNQNGTVLYLDPQVGTVSDRPPYFHRGVPHAANVTSLEALVVGPDGKPMPMSGRALGDFSAQWSNPDQPGARTDGPQGDPMHSLGGPGQMPDALDPAGLDPKAHEPEPEEVRQARDRAYQERSTVGMAVPASIASAPDLDAVFAAGVSPSELAAEADPATLRRLAPHLGQKDAHELTRLFAAPSMQQMLQDTWRTPPQGEPLLAETLVRHLTQRPDLVQMLLATPELMASLTARPLTLHHLASHQQAIGVLATVLDDIAARGTDALIAEVTLEPESTPLTHEQRQITAAIQTLDEDVVQPGFDHRRRLDLAYRKQYLDALYVSAASAQAELNALAVRLAIGADGRAGEPGWRTEPKDRRRAEDKVEKYDGDVSQLRDLAAAKIEFRSLEQLYAALDRLRQEPGVRIVSCDDRFQRPQKSGYRDVQLLLEMTNGHIAEFRLHLAALDRVADWEHALYEVRRDLRAIAKQKGRRLLPTEHAIMDGLLRREQELFWEALRSTYEEEGR